MTYELAKQLKDAGYIRKTGLRYKDHDSIRFWKEDIEHPTLSELIEACGDDFHGILKKGSHFFCIQSYDTDWWIASDGPTPEDAVALLYLRLNKK